MKNEVKKTRYHLGSKKILTLIGGKMSKQTKEKTNESAGHKFIKLNKVSEMTTLAKSTIYEKMKLGEFPQQIPLTKGSVAWIEEEVIEWKKNRIAISRNEEATMVT